VQQAPSSYHDACTVSVKVRMRPPCSCEAPSQCTVWGSHLAAVLPYLSLSKNTACPCLSPPAVGSCALCRSRDCLLHAATQCLCQGQNVTPSNYDVLPHCTRWGSHFLDLLPAACSIPSGQPSDRGCHQLVAMSAPQMETDGDWRM
jgi:hypothetical protein